MPWHIVSDRHDVRTPANRLDDRMPLDLEDTLAQLVERERERFGVPGCAVVVIHAGEVVLRKGFGTRDIDEQLPVETSTLFPIGSSTKTFTAAVCALAMEAGLIGWDEPIAAYLPGFALKDPVATQQLTLRDMLAHRSGLPRHDLLWYAASDGTLTRDDLVQALRHLEPSYGFRERWQYNNLLYTTAGELAARLFGCSYEEAVRKHVLAPLGMDRTNFSVDELHSDDDAARPYVVAPNGLEPVEVPYANLDLIGPAGNINSSVDDLTGWLLELIGRTPAGREPVLSSTVLELLRTPVIPLSEVSPLTIGRSVGYAAGMAVDEYQGYRVFHHGGNIDGFSSQVSTIPETGSGVVVLSNRSSSGLRDALPYVIYDQLLGLEQQAHGQTTWEKEQVLRAGLATAGRGLTEPRPGLPAVRPLTDYVGRYRHPAYGELQIEAAESGHLTVTYRAVSGALHHCHLEVFDLQADLGGEDRHLPVQFFHDLGGNVAALSAILDPAVPPIRFERQAETAHLTEEVLAALAGTYELGPITVDVTSRGGRLSVRIDGGQPRAVAPVGDLRFSAEGITVEFVPPGSIKTPFGEFTRVAQGSAATA
jgi:CubicO group peptidase (beta-lactamase class C family)